MSAADPRFNPVKGEPPALVFANPDSLRIDPVYQRDLAARGSQTLVQHIVENWADILVRLRGDIAELPCVIGAFDSVADEAAGFVALNGRWRAVTALDMFKAAMAAGDEQALLVAALLAEAGLELAPHTNSTAWKPGQVANVGGIRADLRMFGEPAVRAGLRAFAQAFAGQVLRYAGTIIGGVIAVCHDELQIHDDPMEAFERLQTMLARRSQEDWRAAAMRARIDFPALKYGAASALAVRRAWAGYSAHRELVASVRAVAALPVQEVGGGAAGNGGWCEQCDMKVSAGQAAACRSRFCSFRKAG